MEVSTDKVDTEVPSRPQAWCSEAGITLRGTLHAGTVIAVIGQPGEIASSRDAVGHARAASCLRARTASSLSHQRNPPALYSPWLATGKSADFTGGQPHCPQAQSWICAR